MKQELAYIFRVQLYDEDFTIYRDIVVLPLQSISTFLEAIRTTFEYDSLWPSKVHFCESNGDRTQLVDLNQNSTMQDLVSIPNQRFHYQYGVEKEFIFEIQLLSIKHFPKEITFPFCNKKEGIPPAQYTPEELKKMSESDFLEKNIKIKSSIRFR